MVIPTRIPEGSQASDDILWRDIRKLLSDQLEVVVVSDNINPSRTVFSPRKSLSCRLIRGVLGLVGSENDSWNSRAVRLVFEKSCDRFMYWGINSLNKYEPYFISTFNKSHINWLSRYEENGFFPVGVTSICKNISILSEHDGGYSYIFGDDALISYFDELSGGKKAIQEDFQDYIKKKDVNFGDGNIYGYLNRLI